MKALAIKCLAFLGLVVSGLCFIAGLYFFWAGTLSLIWPDVYSKMADSALASLGFAAFGAALIAVGWIVGKRCNKEFAQDPVHYY